MTAQATTIRTITTVDIVTGQGSVVREYLDNSGNVITRTRSTPYYQAGNNAGQWEADSVDISGDDE
jgi:hypothetical protein